MILKTRKDTMSDPLYDSHTIPNTDITLDITIDRAPIPIIQDPTNPWHRKTDWSIDGIIASND